MATRKHLLCDGTGFYPVGSQTPCSVCGGTGVVTLKTCNKCGGTKFYPIGSEEPCYACEGSGTKTNNPARLGEDHYYSHEILDCIDSTEYQALVEAAKDGVRIILSMGIVNMAEGSTGRTSLFAIFPVGKTTRTNLMNLLEE